MSGGSGGDDANSGGATSGGSGGATSGGSGGADPGAGGSGGSNSASSGGATSGGSGGADPGAGGSDGSSSASSGGAASGGSGGADPGAGGSDGSSSASSGGTGSPGCSVFCSDFEADSLPSELMFFPEYLRASASTYVTLDRTGRSGSRSIKVTGSAFSQMLGIAVPSNFWGRIYLKSDTAIQSGHNTYVAATTGDGDPNNGEHIRIGEHQCQLELNRKSDDAERLSGERYSCDVGVKLAADTWYCLEFYYNGPGSEMRVFLDNTEIETLHVTDWGPYDYKLFKFGFEKYHGGNKTIWYDDLALDTERVGCAP
ncbi:hypothetical protein WMF04_37680 [Sorangium sp. So ce260]|uniref:hypothetical protein n=1 Tax=Sorangium sp. So ce260 TaxID=3133291 RepID=UPI003F5EA38B